MSRWGERRLTRTVSLPIPPLPPVTMTVFPVWSGTSAAVQVGFGANNWLRYPTLCSDIVDNVDGVSFQKNLSPFLFQIYFRRVTSLAIVKSLLLVNMNKHVPGATEALLRYYSTRFLLQLWFPLLGLTNIVWIINVYVQVLLPLAFSPYVSSIAVVSYSKACNSGVY